MLVSQIPATVIYTVLKTLLLIMIAKMIESMCSWTKRYDLAKIFENGTYSVAFTAIFTHKNYRNYWTLPMVILLLFMLAIETVTNLLPAIATNYMPFQEVSFTRGDNKYFKYPYSTPTQATRIPSMDYSTDNPMKDYCEDMGLCTNGVYDANVLEISPTMQVERVPYSYGARKFITDYVNVSTPYCVPRETEDCLETSALFSVNAAGHAVVTVPGLPSDVVTYYVFTDRSEYGIGTVFEATRADLEYKNAGIGSISEPLDPSTILSMLYRQRKNDVISVTHLSKILFTNGQETVLLVLKVALHSIAGSLIGTQEAEDGIPILSTIFNNSAILSNITDTYDHLYYNTTIGNVTFGIQSAKVAYTSYVNDYYLSVDIMQRTSYYGVETYLKGRIHYGVFVIKDDTIPINGIPRYNDQQYLTNFNTTRMDDYRTSPDDLAMREPSFYDSMFDGFDERPTNDLYMYAILNSSGSTLYGKEGYRDIVADISPIFLGILCGIILVALLVYGVARYSGDQLYFCTLYQAVGQIDNDGCISSTDDIIPKVSTNGDKFYSGDKTLVTKNNMALLERFENDNIDDTTL